jgi:hypothetical protein
VEILLHVFLKLLKVQVGSVSFGLVDAYFCGKAYC